MIAKKTTSQLHIQAAQHCCFLAFALTSPACAQRPRSLECADAAVLTRCGVGAVMLFETVRHLALLSSRHLQNTLKEAHTLTTLWVPHFLQSNSMPPLDSSCFLPFLPLPSVLLAGPSALSDLRRRISDCDLLAICCSSTASSELAQAQLRGRRTGADVRSQPPLVSCLTLPVGCYLKEMAAAIQNIATFPQVKALLYACPPLLSTRCGEV